jgi:hypothetical protein
MCCPAAGRCVVLKPVPGFVAGDEVAGLDGDVLHAVVVLPGPPPEGHAIDVCGEWLDLDWFEHVLTELIQQRLEPPVPQGSMSLLAGLSSM